MGIATWCDVCLRVTNQPLTKHLIPLDKPLLFYSKDSQAQKAEKMLCPECSRFMDAAIMAAQHWAHGLLVSWRRTELPDVRVTESLLPGEDDGDWAYLIPLDKIMSDKLDEIKVVWPEYPYERMTLIENVKRKMQEENENDGDNT